VGDGRKKDEDLLIIYYIELLGIKELLSLIEFGQLFNYILHND
jgi:hypothetical protein